MKELPNTNKYVYLLYYSVEHLAILLTKIGGLYGRSRGRKLVLILTEGKKCKLVYNFHIM